MIQLMGHKQIDRYCCSLLVYKYMSEVAIYLYVNCMHVLIIERNTKLATAVSNYRYYSRQFSQGYDFAVVMYILTLCKYIVDA